MTPTETLKALEEKLTPVKENCSCCEMPKPPILIGTVLEKMIEIRKPYMDEMALYEVWNAENYGKKLAHLWEPCGFSKSLQEIVGDSGWEEVWTCECGENYIDDIMPKTCLVMHDKNGYPRLKSPQARALVDFLASIFLTDEER